MMHFIRRMLGLPVKLHPSIMRQAYLRERAKANELHEENARLRKLLEDKQ